ncbi:tripartite tricarboxylate transporter substrate-binding protein [Ramlibacter sp. AN1015]|uniref:tripartite tricarboxylate transporter substrate-binding protein n=1 Tax=Ramlibacter sp. AN1015 TaxID=3133428 RepID=UPI0030BC5968
MKRRLCLLGGLLALAMAQAQPLSAPHMTIIVGGPPGTPGDALARALSEPLAREFGRPVMVENKPGAAGTLALAAVSRAAADGSVLGIFALQHAVAPQLVKAMPYDAQRDLSPVRQISTVSNLLVVRADSALTDLAALLRQAQHGRLTYASGGMGTPSQLAAELFAQEVQRGLRHVPFNGPVAGLAALAGGHVDLMFATTPAALPLIHAGKLRPLAITAAQRLAALPHVPTLAELGYPGAGLQDWHGVVAPAGTPAARIANMADAIGQALATPAVQQRLQSLGLEPLADSGPAQFGAFIEAETDRWAAVMRRATGATQ